jgi:hypothetical protein
MKLQTIDGAGIAKLYLRLKNVDGRKLFPFVLLYNGHRIRYWGGFILLLVRKEKEWSKHWQSLAAISSSRSKFWKNQIFLILDSAAVYLVSHAIPHFSHNHA